MNHMFNFAAAGLALCAFLSAAPAAAQGARSFVSAHGNDGNTCSIVAPCRTFARAYATSDAGGEITVLDPAGYGPLTISKALSIVNDGVGEAGIILIAVGNAITINAGVNDAVSLRGLTLDGSGIFGTSGVVFNSGHSLTIQNCVMRRFSSQGIGLFPNAATTFTVSNTVLTDNNTYGIHVAPTGSGAIKAVFNRVEMNNNGIGGIYVDGSASTGTINATASESVAGNNFGPGFGANTAAGQAPTTFTIFHSVAANTDIGIAASGSGATLRIAQSVVTGNVTHGWDVFGGGVIATYGDNYIDGNGPNTGSLTLISKQ